MNVQATAATNVFVFETHFSGLTPAGPPPYLTATFDDTMAGDGFDVRLTVFAANLFQQGNDGESATELYFNLNSSLNSTLLTFDDINVSAIDQNKWSLNDIITGNDSQQADGDGLYDIKFDLPLPRAQYVNRFTNGETLIFDIGYSGPETLNASSFNFFSSPAGEAGPFLAAAHIQNIDGNGDTSAGSGWVAVVPEPVSSTLFIIGGATLGFRRFRKNRKA